MCSTFIFTYMYMYVYIFPSKIFTLFARNPDLPSWDSLFLLKIKNIHISLYTIIGKNATYGAIYFKEIIDAEIHSYVL